MAWRRPGSFREMFLDHQRQLLVSENGAGCAWINLRVQICRQKQLALGKALFLRVRVLNRIRLFRSHDDAIGLQIDLNIVSGHVREMRIDRQPTAGLADLKSALGPSASLGDVFIHYTGAVISDGGDFRDAARIRSTSKRLG